MSAPAIGVTFRQTFQRNIRATYAILVLLTAALFSLYLNARATGAHTSATDFLKKNEDYLLALAVYNNEKSLQAFFADANQYARGVKYVWLSSESTRDTGSAFAIRMGEKIYGAIRIETQWASLIEPPVLLAFFLGFLGMLLIPIQFYRKTQTFLLDKVTSPLNTLSRQVEVSTNLEELKSLSPLPESSLEIQALHQALLQATEEVALTERNAREDAVASALSRVAAQVSHDIRSPLTALEVVTGMLDSVPEEKKQIIRAATGRIRDIANNLLEKHRELVIPKTETLAAKSVFLPPIVERLVSEKRWQYGKQTEKHVEFQFGRNSLETFASVDRVEFQRVISNLMNNAIEALENRGRVIVTVDTRGKKAMIQIQDNGRGIPPQILAKLGELGLSHGKDGAESGSGLGVHHAFQFAKKFGGELKFDSQSGQGTTVTLLLPLVAKPKWHFNRLQLKPTTPIILVDDDPGMKSVWRMQLDKRVSGWSGAFFTFEDPASFEKERVRQGSAWNDAIYLMDFELRDNPLTGLDLIERNGISSQAILVTSRFDEEEIQERCRRMGVSLLPKGMISLVPIDSERSPSASMVQSGSERELSLHE